MAATPGVPASQYLEHNPAFAPSLPNEAETQSTAFASAPFKYAYQQRGGLLAPALEGDRAAIDAVYSICQLFAAPPTSPTLTSLSPNTAVRQSPQFVMTLTGTNFQPGMSVIFGSAAPETRVIIDSTTSARVVVWPTWIPSAGTIAVKVRNGGGAADSGTQNFTVT